MAQTNRNTPTEIRTENPDTDLIEAMQEVEAMKRDPSKGKAYDDVENMMRDLLA